MNSVVLTVLLSFYVEQQRYFIHKRYTLAWTRPFAYVEDDSAGGKFE